MLLRADSLASTHAVAAVLAGLARPGDVIVLAGDMGAGKTALAQGFGRGPRCDRADHVADVHPRAQLQVRQDHVPPRRPVPVGAHGRGRRPGARRAGRVRRHRARRVGRRGRRESRRPSRRQARADRGRRGGTRSSRSRRPARRGRRAGHACRAASRSGNADPRHRDRHRAGQRRDRWARGRDLDVRGRPRAASRRDPRRRRSSSCAARPTSSCASSAASRSTSVRACSPACASGWRRARRWPRRCGSR